MLWIDSVHIHKRHSQARALLALPAPHVEELMPTKTKSKEGGLEDNQGKSLA
jgi:hypothetical protein